MCPKQANIGRVYVNKLEDGRSDPTVGMVHSLAKALGVPVTALLE
jgi:transcriptional regulator with XRE-family HTH domain